MKLRQIKPKRLLKALLKLGFTIKRQKGSHVFIERIVGEKIYSTSISLHDTSLPQGTFRAILSQSGVEESELTDKL